jgi:chaperonin cofactor prefoldin|tara:strand:- start:1002 stop:1223 length:222 start_codon:yes stop_codon:yes gene_type:complete
MEVLMATKKEKDFLHDLDKRMAILEDSMDRLESNHLNHLQKQIDKIDARIWAIILGAVLQLVGIVSIFIGMSN